MIMKAVHRFCLAVAVVWLSIPESSEATTSDIAKTAQFVGNGIESCCICFSDEARGGTLVLTETLGRNARHVTIETSPGEPAESVAKRLASAVNDKDPFEWGIPPGSEQAIAADGKLCGMLGSPGDYILAGTEGGLGIPPPPTSLTCNYDKAAGRLVIQWDNPSSTYDSIRILYNWNQYAHSEGELLSGNCEDYTIDLNKTWPEPILNEWYRELPGDVDIWISAVKEGVPSNAAAVHVNYSVQEELYGIPFTANIAPNWTAWSVITSDTKFVAMGQREHLTAARSNRSYNNVENADEKPFYQVLKSGSSGPTGVMRSFLGLTPGHTYRVTVRMNTFGVAKNSTDWSYSFCAVCTGPKDSPLTARQMAGLDAMPKSVTNFDTARDVEYDNNKQTKGAYRNAARELTMPEGADTITVWVLFKSANPNDSVTMDHVKLEDLGVR